MAALFLLSCFAAGCSASTESAEPAAETQKSPAGATGGITAPIDFGKLVGGGGGGERAPGDTSTPPSGPPSGQGSAYRVRLTKVMDSSGWEQPVEIARFLIPADWKSQGGAVWDQKSIRCVPNIVQTHFGSASPDDLSGMDIAPPYTWVSSDNPEVAQLLQQQAAQGGCPVAAPLSAAQYLERIVIPRYRKGATVLDRQPEPEIAKAKRAAAEPTLAALKAQGGLRDFRYDSASLHIAYQRNGQPVEEWLTVSVLTLATPTPTLSGMQRGVMNDGTQVSSIAENVIAIRAPQGKFDNQLAATIIASIRPNPVYEAAVSKFQQNMNNIALKGAMDRARIWREAAQEISRTINDSYRNTQAAQDRAAARFSQYIRGVETYHNPTTGQPVELTSGYSHVWAGPSDVYVLSNDPNLVPEGYTRIQPVP